MRYSLLVPRLEAALAEEDILNRKEVVLAYRSETSKELNELQSKLSTY